MDIFFKILKLIVTIIVHVVVIGGLIIFLAWAIWDVTPQTSITKTAYFFSESWRLITGQQKSEQTPPQVTRDQLKKSQQHIRYIEK